MLANTVLANTASTNPSSAADSMVAIVDCASFFASCERVFEPKLAGVPLVVLSNNDGCVVAMSSEAKKLGIPMGIAWFKLRAWAESNGVVARSSNYELYGSLSARVMQIISRYSAWQEVYSIDESFIGLKGDTAELIATGQKIRQSVLRETGLPVRVGIAKTKTLAKLAILGAKKNLQLNGVCHLGSYAPARLDEILAKTPVQELWGVAGRLTKRLAGEAIFTAKDLRDADPARVRKRYSVVLQRSVMELRGVPCIEIDGVQQRRRQLIFSRSFAKPVTSAAQMRQVVSIYAQKLSSRLRAQGLAAKSIAAWAATGHYEQGTRHYAHSAATLTAHTSDPVVIAKAAAGLLADVLHGVRYARAGIILTDLAPPGEQMPFDIFLAEGEGRDLGVVLDAVTGRFGDSALGVGLGGLKERPSWNMKRELMSPRATTHWNELALVKAC